MGNAFRQLFDLTGKAAIITGASKGIGEAVARGLAAFGAKVVVSSRKQEAVEAVAKSIQAEGGEALAVAAHMGDASAINNLAAAAKGHFGGVDIIVNNAAANPVFGPLLSVNEEAFAKIMQVNVWGSFRCLRAELRQMYRQGSGSIVNVSSASVFGMHTELGPYIASKAAVLAMSRVAGKEAGPRGVRVNAVCPGLTDTPMLQLSMVERPETEDVLAQIPIRRMAHPTEIAEAILWLCSDRSSFTNGSALVADGGRSG